MSSQLRTLLALIGALALASCGAGSGIRLIPYGTTPPYAVAMYAAWAGSGGPMLIELRGNPYPDSPDRVAQIMAEAATSNYVLASVAFTSDPKLAWRPDWRVVYAFGSTALGQEQVCEAGGPPSPAPPGPDWYALVVFCNGRTAINSIGASSPSVPGPDTPQFRAYAVVTLRGLFNYGSAPGGVMGN
jgi:hypothetical protein